MLNVIANCCPGHEYLMKDLIATRLTAADFERVKAANPERFKNYRFIPGKEVDFLWWHKIHKKLTKTKIVQAYFDCDYHGNITEY
jgi:hypothetical protein